MAARANPAGPVSTRLLLDEMFHPRIATELAARGHDCLAIVAEEKLRESSDSELLAYAVAEGRALVTNNVIDFERLRRRSADAGEAVPALIYTSDATFPRNRQFIGRLIDALDHACITNAVTSAGGVYWLRPE